MNQELNEIEARNLAVADKKPAKVETPKPTFFMANYKCAASAVVIGFILLAAWVVAEFVIAG